MPEDPQPKPKLITKADYTPAGEGRARGTGVVFGGKSQSKYDRGSILADIGNLNEVRARNQGFWDALGNTGVNLVTTLVGQTVSTFGALIDPITKWVGDTDMKATEGLTGVGQDIQDYGQRENPIYYNPKEGILSIDYILSHLPSVVSSAAMLIPGMGIGRGAGLLARAARLGGLGEELVAMGAGSLAMRHAENWMESAQVYNQIMQEGAMGLDPRYEKLGYEEIERGAKVGAAQTYASNWGNIIFDMMQMGAILKPIKGLTGWTNTIGKESKFAQVMDYGYKAAVDKGILKDASRLNKAGLFLGNATRPLLQQTTEGIEEAWNDISSKEGHRAGMIAAGAMPDDGSNFFDRLKGYTQDWSMWDSAIWGVIGGVTFQAGGAKLNQLGAKAGWWNDTTAQGQILGDLKQRSDIVTRGYKDLSNPALTEYDKAKVKGNMLFNLVKSNKSRESLDMLKEDLENPIMVKKFSEMMGLNEEDTLKEMANVKKDVEFINDQIDFYTGATTKNWFGAPAAQHTGIGLEENQTIDTPAIQRFRYKRDGKKVPFVYDIRAAQTLAYNDYSIMVKDRLNAQAAVEMQGLQERAFAGTDMDVNARSVFTLTSDIAALVGIIRHENADLQDRKARKLSDVYIQASQSRLSKAQELLVKRDAQRKALEETMNANNEAKLSETTYKQAETHAINTLGADKDTGKHAGLKAMYYSHLLDKEEALLMNNNILQDPKKFVEDYLESDTSNKIFEETKKTELERGKAEQAAIDSTLADLQTENNEEYANAEKRHTTSIEEALTKFPTDKEKESYLANELISNIKEYNDHEAAGKFSRKNMAEFSTNFDKKLYTQLKARENALKKAMKPYMDANIKEATASAEETGDTTKKSGAKGASIIKQRFEDGTPGHYWQGMVRGFGENAKGGIFTNNYIKDDLANIIEVYEMYAETIPKLQGILKQYAQAKAANDPNAKTILSQATGLTRETGFEYNIAKPEEEMANTLQQELQFQEEKYADLDDELHSPITETKAWTIVGGVQGITEVLGGKKDESGSKAVLPSYYPEVYAFLEGLVNQYKDPLTLMENLPAVYTAITAEVEKAKDAYENWKAGTYRQPASGKEPTEDIIRQKMDQDQTSANTTAQQPASKHFDHSDKVFPATHSAKITEHKDWSTVYVEDKQRSNPDFTLGHTIYVGEDGSTMNGFVSRGKDVVFTYRGEYHGSGATAEKKIDITDKDGNFVGNLDTTYRLNKVIATLRKELNDKTKTPSKERKAKLEGTISKYEELKSYYIELRQGFLNDGDQKVGVVADRITTAEDTVESGGVRFGEAITTQEDKNGKSVPINIDSAFKLETINKKGGVYLAVFADGDFYVTDPNTGKYVKIETLYGKDMVIPTFAKNPKPLAGKGVLDGSVFALVPTNTFDRNGKRIYMSFKQRTRNITNVKMTSNGKMDGKTIPEQMLEVLTNPDSHSEEFRMLAASVNVPFDKGLKITDQKAKLHALFTTENLLEMFNRVVYVYDSTVGAKRFMGRDYSHHIGMSVQHKKGATEGDTTRPYIRFDLSNDPSKANTFAVLLFDKDGNFNPQFGEKTVAGEAGLNEAQKATAGKLSQGRIPVNVKDEIVKRLRQKLISVDMKLIGRTAEKTERNAFQALVLQDGKLIEKPYDSYLHYLSDKQVIESTIHGVDFNATDPVTNETKRGRTYFDNQSFWFDMNPAKPNEQPKPAGASANNNTSQKGAAATGKKKPGRKPKVKPAADQSKDPEPEKKDQFIIPPALEDSIKQQKAGKIVKVGSGPDSYYMVNGVRHERLSHVTKGASDITGDPIDAGSIVDTAIKNILNGQKVDLSNFSEKAAANITKGVKRFKKHLKDHNQEIIGTDIILHAMTTDRNGKPLGIAGETDIMTVDNKGNVFIYDFKTSNASFSMESYKFKNPSTGTSRYDENQRQLSGYSDLLEHMTKSPALGIGIIPFTITYKREGKELIINAAEPYNPILFPDMVYVSATNTNKTTEKRAKTKKDTKLTDDRLGNMGFDSTEIAEEPREYWMSDQKKPSPMPSFIDVGRFRDNSRSYYEQKGFEDYTAQVMLDILYERQNQKEPSFEQLIELVREKLAEQIETHELVLRDIEDTGGVMYKGVFRPQSADQVSAREYQLEKLEELSDSLDEVPDFVGYGKTGFMILSANKVVDVDVTVDELTIKGPEDQPYTIRYQENYSVKINPKSTISKQAKLFLSRIAQLNRSTVDGNLVFKRAPNMFGVDRYVPIDTVLDSLYIDFEGVAPEGFMNKLNEMNNNNPIVRAVMNTLTNIENTDEDRANQLKHQLTTILKQRRDMKFMKVETDDDGHVQLAKIIDAARLGVKNNIIKEWENLFRAQFQNLFKLDEKDDNLRSSNHTATARKLDINYAEKGTQYDRAELHLPKEFSKDTHKTAWQTEWLYNELKAIAKGNSKKLVKFNLESGNIVVDGHRLELSERDAAHMLLLFQGDNIVVDRNLSHLFTYEKKNIYISETILEQIVNNIDYFSRLSVTGVTSGDEGALKDSSGYSPIYYKILADQLQRLGIQLAEDPEVSWTVLQDLNSPLGGKDRRKFHLYDPRGTTFNRFMVDKIGERVVQPLKQPNAFTVGQQELIDEDGGEFLETQKTINIETPFGHSTAGLDPFARHSRSEWYSYVNSTIRNGKGDLEYTYTDPNGLSTLLAKLKDDANGFLAQVAATPMGRNNVFIQELLNNPAALNAFTLHYVDAGKIDNYSVVEPDSLNAAKSHLLIWNNYYNNETATKERNRGGFITTHSDSSIMPIFNFEKQTIPLNFVENIADDGTRTYRVKLDEFLKNKDINPAYRHLYGIFRGELERIQETYEIWKDINSKNPNGTTRTDEEKMQYAFKNYTMGIHFNYKDGKLSKGNGINILNFGSTLAEGNNSGIYKNDGKDGLMDTLFDSVGDPIDGEIKGIFDTFVNVYLNELIDDAYNELKGMGDGFFTTVETKRSGKSSDGGTKTTTIELKPTLLDATATAAMKTLFERNAKIINSEGKIENVTLRKTGIERDYTDKQLAKDGMTEEEIAVFQAEAAKVRAADTKASTYSELFMRYLVADMAINHSIFYGSLFAIMADPSIFENANDYSKFKDVFEKRMKGPVSPGKVDYFADNEPVRVLPFEDITNSHIKISLDGVKLSEHETEFINEFNKQFADEIKAAGGRHPSRIFDYMAFYYGQPKADRNKAWKVIRDRMNDKITDGGSYMSTKEWLYRAYRQGDITKQEYFDTLDYYYTDDKGKQAVGARILKYVYAGNNIVGVGDSYSNIYSYIKDSQMPLVPGMFKGSVLDHIREKLDAIEKKEYESWDKNEPSPGIIMLPRSSFKTGFSSVAQLIDDNGVPTQDLENTRILQLNRGWLREQIQAPDEKDKRATITAQGNVLADLDATAERKYGKRGLIRFSYRQSDDPTATYDTDGTEVEVDEAGTGVSSNVMQTSMVNTVIELAKRRLMDKMYELGIRGEEGFMEIDNITQFLSKMKSQSLNQFGIGSIAASYLNAIEENEATILPIPISFTTAGKRIQSVLLSELKEIFYKLTLPGGAFTQFSSAGVYSTKNFTADSQLKSYRVHVEKSKRYDSAEAARKDFLPDEIYKEWDPVTGVVEYFTHEPAEAAVPWLFKDSKGNALKYEDYVNKDGTPILSKFDPRLFEFSAFRVPNTGPNSSLRLKAVKFIKPGHGDGIATAPEVVAIIGADFDYDKLYTYMYNYTISKTGRLEKVDSALHSSQEDVIDGKPVPSIDFGAEDSKRQFAKNQLNKEEEYRRLRYRLKQAKASKLSLDEQLFNLLQATEVKDDGTKVTFADLAELRKMSDPKILRESLKVMEDEMMNTREFERDYAKASIYEKQSVAALENALIDRFNVTLGDFKTLRQMTTPTSSAWLEDQVSKKDIPSITPDGTKTHVSINEALNDKKYHAITSFMTFNRSRLANASAARVIAMAANAQISQYQGQRWNLFINKAAYLEEYHDAYQLRFNDKSGKPKEENAATRDNSSYPSNHHNPYKLEANKKVIYEAPDQGRFRLDRIWVMDDNGNKVYISTVIQSILQAALDHQKNPLIDKASINPDTLNAAIALARLGYVDEIVPLMKQEAVNDYVLGSSNYYNIENTEKRIAVLIKTVEKYAKGYGYDDTRLWNIFNSLPQEYKNSTVFMQRVMDEIQQDKKQLVLSTKDLNLGVAQRAGLVQKDEEYNLRQLEALRSYVVADMTGRQLFNIQNSTAAYTKGLKTSFAAMELQQMMFNALFKYNPENGKFKSSTPLIGGLHRINRAWAKDVGRTKEYKPTMMSFGQFYGLNPAMKMVLSLQGSVFTEFTHVFRQAREQAFLTSIGKSPNAGNIATIGAREYERVFNKINTNLVSFMFSNPQLYSHEDFISDPDEYKLLEEYGIELITRPHKDIPYNEKFELFNSPKSLAQELIDLSTMTNPETGNKYVTDFDVLDALQSIVNTSYKTPSSVVYNNTFGYQENVNHRIAMSLAEMMSSTDAKINGVAKKLVLYAFMTGGITSPKSFVQFIPPQLLLDMGFDKILRGMLDELKKPGHAKVAVETFMIQYYQHHPFELKAEIKEGDLIHKDGTFEQKDKETGITMFQINELKQNEYKDKYIFRMDNRLFVKLDNTHLIQIDNLGMTKWHRNEYSYNTKHIPGESMYSHNVVDASRVRKDGVEVKGVMTEAAEVSTEAKEMLERENKSLLNKLMDKPTDIDSLITDAELDKSNLMATAVLGYLRPILTEMGVKVAYKPLDGALGLYTNKEGEGPLITISTSAAMFKGITSGDPADMNMHRFLETLAHEATHAATVRAIYDVMTGKEKNKTKIAAVNRLIELRKTVYKMIEADPKLSKTHHSLVLLEQTVNERSKIKGDNDKQREMRQMAEFVAYLFTRKEFQEDANKMMLNTKESWWSAFIKAVLKALGLNITPEAAQDEVTTIKKRLTSRQSYIGDTGDVDRRNVGLSDTLLHLNPYSALHVAFREIMTLSTEVKRDILSKGAEARIAAKLGGKGKSPTVEMIDLYQDVANFDPTWSEEMMREYHKANLNSQIIC